MKLLNINSTVSGWMGGILRPKLRTAAKETSEAEPSRSLRLKFLKLKSSVKVFVYI